ncbi:MAG: helix-turn-helix domain-containing protein [Candidatus Latescibacterota bacterium]|nr:MAG: helix-turn-helix domain-containing protein [Candidatus Latescibacterota bacterium]
MPSREELGRRLKTVRLEKGLTLKDVELLSGVSMTHTSQIERGMTSPTIGALEKLARALDRPAGFFVDDGALDATSLVGRSDRSVLLSEKCGIRFEGLTRGIAGGSLHLYFLHATPVTSEPALRKHDGEEALTVLKGSLDVLLGDERRVLRSGETLHFRSSIPHAFFSSARIGAEGIWVSTAPPVF